MCDAPVYELLEMLTSLGDEGKNVCIRSARHTATDRLEEADSVVGEGQGNFFEAHSSRHTKRKKEEKQNKQKKKVSVKKQIRQLEEEHKAKEASFMEGVVQIIKRHFVTAKERQSKIEGELSRVRQELVETTEKLVKMERQHRVQRQSSAEWKDRYHIVHEQLLASRHKQQRGSFRSGVTEPHVTPNRVQSHSTAVGARVSNDQDGAYIDHVVPGGLAEVTGLRVGDVVKGFNGKLIRSAKDLVEAVCGADNLVGSHIALERCTKTGDKHCMQKIIASLDEQVERSRQLRFSRSRSTMDPGKVVDLDVNMNAICNNMNNISKTDGESLQEVHVDVVNCNTVQEMQGIEKQQQKQERPQIPKLPLHIFPQNNIPLISHGRSVPSKVYRKSHRATKHKSPAQHI